MTPIAIAADDIVATREEAAGNEREPLVVTEPLAAFLDEHGIGSGARSSSRRSARGTPT